LNKIIKMAISVLLLCIALYFLDWGTLLIAFKTLNPLMFLLALFTCILIYLIMFIRWYMLTNMIVRLSFRAQMKIYYYSNFLNTFTPANLGSDIYRLVSLKKFTDSKLSILFCLIKERMLGLLSYLFLYLFFLAVLWVTDPEWIGTLKVYNITGLFIIFIILVIFEVPFIKGFLEICANNFLLNIFGKIFTYIQEGLCFETQNKFLKLIGLSLVGTCVWILMVGIVANSLGIDISFQKLGLVVILAELVRLVPASIQGIGLREGTYACLFKLNGMSPEAGFLLGLISYLVLSLTLVVSGGISFFIAKER